MLRESFLFWFTKCATPNPLLFYPRAHRGSSLLLPAIVKQQPSPSRAEIQQLLREAEESLWSNVSQAHTLAKRGLKQARALPERILEAHFRIVDAAAYRSEGAFAQARAGYEKVLTIARPEGLLTLQAKALVGLAFILHNLDDDAGAALRMLQQARELAIQAKDPYTEGAVLQMMYTIHYHLGDVVGAAEAGMLSYSRLEESGNYRAASIQLGNLGMLFYHTDQMDEALEVSGRALAVYENSGENINATDPAFALLRIQPTCVQGFVKEQLGEFEAALAIYQSMLELSRECGFRNIEEEQKLHIGRTLGRMGRHAEAHEILQNLRSSPQPKVALDALLLWVSSMIKLGRALEAQDELNRTIKNPKEQLQGLLRGEYYETLSNLYRSEGKFEQALIAKDESASVIAQIYASPAARSRISATYVLLQMEREKHQREIERMKIAETERELSNATLQLIAQTELLSELREDLLHMAKKFSVATPNERMSVAKELRDRIKNLPCKAVDWTKFDTQFKAAHPEFTKKLIERYPTLSPQELRICSLLRMNLTSEAIAQLLCLSERTIESHRLRIRRKMTLTTREEDLTVHLARM